MFEQISGVAMGTKMGTSYANLFVSYIEHQFFNQYNGPNLNSPVATASGDAANVAALLFWI